ncbi:MAG: BTAD domain-containing putative transcriptional regulator [Gammaproteobacteria bacterium]
MFELNLLGGATLRENASPLTGPAVRRHPMALLAILATATERTASRAKAVGLLWPDADEATARNRLRSTLYPLRKLMGQRAIVSSGDSLRLDDASLACDVWHFRHAIEAGDVERAVRLYRGPFLDGFCLEGSSLFDEHVRSEREALDRAWRQAVESLAERAADSPPDSVRWWRQLNASDPLDSRVAGRLVQALAAAGNRPEALRVAAAHEDVLRRELGVEADAAFRSSVERIRSDASVLPDSEPGAREASPGIAVLPFERLGGRDDDGLGDGIHSGIVTRLAQLEGLSVIARTSVRAYRDTQKQMSQIAGELGVRWVMEGDIQTSGDRLRLNVRLVEAPRDHQTWGEDYVRSLTPDDVFHVQSEIAGEIVERIRGALTNAEQARLARRPTESLEAYRLAVQGRMHLDHRSPGDMERALACFEEALGIDPDYAVARVGVADALGLLHAYGHAGEDVLPRAEEAIRTALERDPGSAEAHAAMGRLLGQRNRNEEALAELRLALELQPGYAEAHSWMTIGLQIGGAPHEAIRSARRAVSLNPLSIEAVGNLAASCLFAGRLDEAIAEAHRCRALDGDYATAAFFEALARYEKQQFGQTIELLQALEVPWAGCGVTTVAALATAAMGEAESARGLLEEIRCAGFPFDEGLVLAALGETDAAFEAFGRARFDGLDFAESYWPTVAVRYLFGRVWDVIRGDRRFRRLGRRVDEAWGRGSRIT